MILRCTCQHDQQDEYHGPHRRIHNPVKLKTGQTERRYRCTVCGTERPRGERLTQGKPK